MAAVEQMEGGEVGGEDAGEAGAQSPVQRATSSGEYAQSKARVGWPIRLRGFAYKA